MNLAPKRLAPKRLRHLCDPAAARQAWSVEVGLQGASATDVAGPAVEASSQGIGVANVHLNGADAQLFKHLLNWDFIGVHHDTLFIKH